MSVKKKKVVQATTQNQYLGWTETEKNDKPVLREYLNVTDGNPYSNSKTARRTSYSDHYATWV